MTDYNLAGTDVETNGLNEWVTFPKDFRLPSGKVYHKGERVHGAQFHSLLEMAFVLLDERNEIKHEIRVGIRPSQDTMFILRFSPFDTKRWCLNQHTKSGLLAALTGEEHSIKHTFDAIADTAEEAEEVVLAWLEKCGAQHADRKARTGIKLFGSTIRFDMDFYNYHCPRLMSFFHYRTVDVSAVKEFSRASEHLKLKTPKKELAHTALADIRETHTEMMAYYDQLTMK